MSQKIIVSPSLLSLDFTKFNEQIEIASKDAEWLHFDVMDGHFVPNLSYGPKILEEVLKVSDNFMDVHIMVTNPKDVSEWFVQAGADNVTFHIEAVESLEEAQEIIAYLHDNNVKAGISLKPATPVEAIEPILKDCDVVLVMSVEPGFGGQSFMEEMLKKVSRLSQLKKDNNYRYLIEIDGGINEETGKRAKSVGAEVLVAGSYVFNGDITKNIKSLLND